VDNALEINNRLVKFGKIDKKILLFILRRKDEGIN